MEKIQNLQNNISDDPNKQIILYIRVSTKNQLGPEHLSLNHQIEKAQKYAQYHDYTIKKIFRDEGKSARSINGRKGLKNALNYIKIGNIFVVYSMSRLSRNVKEFLQLINKISEKGATLVSLTEEIDTKSPTGKLMINIMASFNQFESDSTSSRTKDIIDAKIKRGEFVGRIPYGYQKDGNSKILIKNPREQIIIEKIILMRNKNNMSFRAVALKLEENGIPPGRYSKKWYPSSVSTIFKKHSQIDNKKTISGRPPYGYKYDKITKELIEVKHQQNAIKRILRMRNNRNMSFKQIALQFDNDGVPPNTNAEYWHESVIRRLYDKHSVNKFKNSTIKISNIKCTNIT